MLRSLDNTARKRAGSQRSRPLPSNACLSFPLNCECEKGWTERMLDLPLFGENDQSPLNLVRFTPCTHANTPSQNALGLVHRRVPATWHDQQTWPYHTRDEALLLFSWGFPASVPQNSEWLFCMVARQVYSVMFKLRKIHLDFSTFLFSSFYFVYISFFKAMYLRDCPINTLYFIVMNVNIYRTNLLLLKKMTVCGINVVLFLWI